MRFQVVLLFGLLFSTFSYFSFFVFMQVYLNYYYHYFLKSTFLLILAVHFSKEKKLNAFLCNNKLPEKDVSFVG